VRGESTARKPYLELRLAIQYVHVPTNSMPDIYAITMADFFKHRLRQRVRPPKRKPTKIKSNVRRPPQDKVFDLERLRCERDPTDLLHARVGQDRVAGSAGSWRNSEPYFVPGHVQVNSTEQPVSPVLGVRSQRVLSRRVDQLGEKREFLNRESYVLRILARNWADRQTRVSPFSCGVGRRPPEVNTSSLRTPRAASWEGPKP